MDTLLEVWGLHLNEQAMRLLQNAKMVADTQHISVNILHVFFVALTDTNLYVYQRFKDVLKSDGLLKSDVLATEESIQGLISEVEAQMAKDVLYFSLDMCKLACMEVALARQVQISDTLIVEQIIDKSYSVKRILQRDHMLSVMKKALQVREKSNRSPGKRTSSGPLNENEVRKVLEKVKVVSPTREDSQRSLLTRLDEALHRITFDNLLKILNLTLNEHNRKMVLLCGQNGSVFDQDKLGRVLAYRLTSVQEKESAAEPDQPVLLAGYQLWQLSLHTLRALYTDDPRFHPVLALKHLKQEAKSRQAILLLTELETISSESSVDRRIKEQLASQDETCVVSCYKYYDQPPGEQELLRGLNRDSITVLFPERGPDLVQVHQWVEEYCRQQYPQYAISLDPGALERLLLLEPGIWIYKQRKAFPALSIDILNSCISMLVQEPSSFRRLAQGARLALDDLLGRELRETPTDVGEQFHGALQEAHEHMRQLMDRPRLEFRQGEVVITQAFIEAQVFNSHTCEFHLPGHFPWTIPRKA